MTRPFSRFIFSLSAIALTACGAATAITPPTLTLAAYAAAVRSGDADAAHALLTEEQRAEVPLDEFRRLMTENQAELTQQADLVARQSEETAATATVALASGDRVTLVAEGGRWRIDGGILDAPTLRTPQEAVTALRRALQRRSLRGIERVLARQSRSELEAEIERVLEETADELDLEIEVRGNEALIRLTGGRVLHLRREAAEWHVVSLQ